MLAAIPKAPSAYSPYSSPVWNPSITPADNYFDENGLIASQQYILDQMAKQGYITQAQADAAKNVDIISQIHDMPTDHYAGIKYPYFVLSAKKELPKRLPSGGHQEWRLEGDDYFEREAARPGCQLLEQQRQQAAQGCC